ARGATFVARRFDRFAEGLDVGHRAPGGDIEPDADGIVRVARIAVRRAPAPRVLVANREGHEGLGIAWRDGAPALSPYAVADHVQLLGDGTKCEADVDRARGATAGRVRVGVQHDIGARLGAHEVRFGAQARLPWLPEVLRRNDDVLLV